MLKKFILVRYGEIGIKSPRVRARFEKRLVSNIKNRVSGKIIREPGRIYLHPVDLEEALQLLPKIFGIVSFSPTVVTETNEEAIKDTITTYVDDLIEKGDFYPDKSFAIRCRRTGDHDFTSQEMGGYCGSVVVELTGAPVDLTNPEFELFVEVRDDKTYIFHQKIPGPGGLPLGTQGKVIALVSGGIDSPVATYLMMKRGCSVTMVNFNNHPYTSGSSEKILKIHKKLKEYSSGSPLKLYQVSYGDFLKKCKEEAPERMTCVLCKSGMYQIAGAIAKKEKALAIVDGSSIGQVASQTLPNILATRHCATLPILSPLIGLDKLEIEKIAKKIGTFPLSILPDSGCSAAPRHPETNAELDRVLEVQERLDMSSELDKVLSTLSELENELEDE